MSAQQPQNPGKPCAQSLKWANQEKTLIRRDFLLRNVRFPPFDNPIGG